MPPIFFVVIALSKFSNFLNYMPLGWLPYCSDLFFASTFVIIITVVLSLYQKFISPEICQNRSVKVSCTFVIPNFVLLKTSVADPISFFYGSGDELKSLIQVRIRIWILDYTMESSKIKRED